MSISDRHRQGNKRQRQRLQFHPLANLFPLIEGDEFAALVEDVRANGLLVPIVLHEGMILEGRNRLRACRRRASPPDSNSTRAMTQSAS